MVEGVLIHYGELALKGGNRAKFERRLVGNIHRAVGKLGLTAPERRSSRLLLRLPEGTDVDAVLDVVAPLPGIAWFARATLVPADLEEAKTAIRRLARTVEGKGPFKVDTKRADKRFPMDSPEINRELGAVVFEETGRPVDLKNPETVFGVRVTEEGIYLHADRREGVGGLPTGTAGRLLSLVSGGIDSPSRPGCSCAAASSASSCTSTIAPSAARERSGRSRISDGSCPGRRAASPG
jgi:thiamine biosynthesis protein ThiI